MPTMNDSSTPQATTPSEPAAVPIEQLLGDARAARIWRAVCETVILPRIGWRWRT